MNDASKPPSDDARVARIEDAAYKLLIKKGFKSTSMLDIAKAAKASNETLYRWYGNKQGLFATMIERNTRAVESELGAVREAEEPGIDALDRVGAALLGMVTGEKAVALNRAAAGDISGHLGRLLASEGRMRVGPQIGALLAQVFGPDVDLERCREDYIALLIGDLQIRRATGAIGPLTAEQIEARAKHASHALQQLYPV